jgi:single-strand DNA-binding protein
MPDSVVMLAGNVTRDPEVRYTPSGQAKASFGLAVNRRWQNRQTQEWEEQVSFFDVVCWGRLAENVSETITKGTRALVTGRLEQRSWETDQGEKRSKVEISADDVAPSLKWASATVQRNPRDGEDSWERRPAPRSSGGGDYAHGEEPF